MNELIAVNVIRMTVFDRSLQVKCSFSVSAAAEAECDWEGFWKCPGTKLKALLLCGFVGVCKHWCVCNETYLHACMHEKLKHDSEADGCVFTSVHIYCSKAALN